MLAASAGLLETTDDARVLAVVEAHHAWSLGLCPTMISLSGWSPSFSGTPGASCKEGSSSVFPHLLRFVADTCGLPDVCLLLSAGDCAWWTLTF